MEIDRIELSPHVLKVKTLLIRIARKARTYELPERHATWLEKPTS